MGTQIAETRPNRYTSGWTYGNFAFNGGFTQRNPQTSDSTSGNSIASFLLGDVASGNTDINAQSSAVFRTYGLYIQDNFTVTSKLSLNLGLRWDLQTPITERWDRLVTGFDPNAKYALGSATASGGLTFAKPGARSTWNAKYTGFQPRFGLAYQIQRRLVMRASYGMSYLPLGGTGGLVTVRQNGYSRSTPYVSTSGGGASSYIPNLPGNSTWDNPFPAGVLQPYGNTLGARTFVGQGITYDDPNYEIPRVHQFNVGFEYELPLVEDCAGSLLRRQPHAQAEPHPERQRHLHGAALAVRCQHQPLHQLRHQPLRRRRRTRRHQPVQRHYQYGSRRSCRSRSSPASPRPASPTEPRPATCSKSAPTSASARACCSISLTASGKIMQTRGYREAQYTWLYRTLADYDRTHHIAFTFQYDLPIGKRQALRRQCFRRYRENHRRLAVQHLARIDDRRSHRPSRRLQLGQPRTARRSADLQPVVQHVYLAGQRLRAATARPRTKRWSGCNYPTPTRSRSYDDRFPNIRNPWATQVNMSLFKNFKIRERMNFQLRGEAFNAFNTPIYQGPDTGLTSNNFGRVTISQQNFPRSMQFAFRLQF